MQIVLGPQTPLHPAVPFEAVCRGHSNFQAERPLSSPITQSLGCAGINKTTAKRRVILRSGCISPSNFIDERSELLSIEPSVCAHA
jgi:hypothetical protein